MKIISSPVQLKHNPRQIMLRGKMVVPVERPERLDLLVKSLCEDGHQNVRPDAHALEPVFRVHDRGYIDFLREACAEWRKLPDASDDVMPNTHSRRFLRTALKRLLISELNGRRALGPLPRPALRWERWDEGLPPRRERDSRGCSPGLLRPA